MMVCRLDPWPMTRVPKIKLSRSAISTYGIALYLGTWLRWGITSNHSMRHNTRCLAAILYQWWLLHLVSTSLQSVSFSQGCSCTMIRSRFNSAHNFPYRESS
ncbi:hypothetical protein K449DRAFT_43372 [Hypoxylon sp. EC38]|nr:hypothetical protein K449DRAFT_43372 [Hypoxylon sp. EC38]